MNRIKVGLAGYGYAAATFHLPFIQSNSDLVLNAIYQRSPAPPAGTKKKHCTIDHPNVKHFTSFGELLANGDVDLIVIATGDDVHADFTIQALEAGKHVICEKPLARTSQEADRMIQSQRTSGKILSPFQNRRFDSDFRTAQSLIDGGFFGEIHEFEAHYDFDLPPFVLGLGSQKYTPGQGLFYMVGVHKLDQVLALFGSPATVTAFTRVLRPNGEGSDIEDSFTLILTYAKDGPHPKLVVTVKCNTATKLHKPLAYLVRGYKGSFIKYGGDLQEDHTDAGLRPTDDEYGLEPEDQWGELTTDAKVKEIQTKMGDVWVGKIKSLRGNYSQYYANVVDAIRGGQLAVLPKTSRDGLKIIELARESARLGQTLPFS